MTIWSFNTLIGDSNNQLLMSFIVDFTSCLRISLFVYSLWISVLPLGLSPEVIVDKPHLETSASHSDAIPFDCEPAFYQVNAFNGQSVLVKYDIEESIYDDIQFDTIAIIDGFELNSAGFNPLDNFIYCLTRSNHLIRIHADGTYLDLGELDIQGNTYVGDFTATGDFYILGFSENVYVTDVTTLEVNEIVLDDEFHPADWAYYGKDNSFYGVSSGFLYRYDISTGQVSTQDLAGTIMDVFVSAFMTQDGFLYVAGIGTYYLLEIELATLYVDWVAHLPFGNVEGSDGIACQLADTPFVPQIIARNDTICVDVDSTTTIDVLSNDLLFRTYFGSVEIIQTPMFGAVTKSSSRSLTYTATSFVRDSFVYSICSDDQSNILCDTATVILNPPIISELHKTICQRDTFEFRNQLFVEEGVYEIMFEGSRDECDSLIILALTIVEQDSSIISATICEGNTYDFGGQSYETTGRYRYNVDNLQGCDSLLILDLSVEPQDSLIISETICAGDTYDFGGQMYGVAGRYIHTNDNPLGCDSLMILELAVTPQDSSITSVTICEGDTYDFEGQTYSTAGEYRHIAGNSQGCDSLLILDLTVDQQDSLTMNVTICEGDTYDFGGETYSTSGQYRYTIGNPQGCDSLLILDLIVDQQDSLSMNVTICEGDTYDFGGQIYSNAGQYRYSADNSLGCDSLLILTLEVEQQESTTIHKTICIGDSIEINERIFANAGVYQISKANPQGCDSLITLDLKVEKENCIKIYVPNIFSTSQDIDNNRLTLYTNYTASIQNIDFTIYDRWGKLIWNSSNHIPNDTALGWDGSLNGSAIVAGVYVWTAVVDFENKERMLLSGNVLLLD